ncbi:MAG TPA: DNA repair protein RadC [Candidatus Saccharimonadales bacterium]|nr:DNA repair protein RadC [Candidatus Saccharimonadales bacterium]
MPKLKSMKQMPLIDRPREKMQRKGVRALSDFELLEVMIGSGNGQADVGAIAKQIQKLLRQGTQVFTFESLTALRGVSTAQASKMLASLELAQRHLVRDVQPLKTHQDILARLDDIRTKQQEYFICLSIDGGQRLIAQRTITIGTLDTVLAHPREVFSDPIVDRAAYVIVAHNHPSGDPQPSQKDSMLTQQLVAAGQLLGIPLRDHIIVTKNSDFSYRQRHLM